ncbi:MAG: CaiB/BaiF CoA-transferase family protein [Candidatus Kaistia colombiensis]|nr:MAG: CaiB/BaiF CoA-transferase family protein [Kaistia sp.]
MLEGLRVVSFCHYLQGPSATQYLADMGADVIKIESTNGAFERHWSGAGTYIDGVSGFFLGVNRNKRIVALDLKSEAGKEAALRIIDSADAVVENYRPGVLDRLGLGYEALKARKPDIVFASATGFGSTGPLSSKPGQDLLAQARSGLIYATGAGATGVGAAVCDQHGAALLALGVLGGLTRKLLSGQGTRVESNLLNAGLDLHAESLINFFSGGFRNEQFDRDKHLVTWFHEAPYGVYRIAGGAIVLSSNDPRKLARALRSDVLASMVELDRYESRDEYVQVIAELLAERTLESLEPDLDAEQIWWAPVQDFEGLRNDPQIKHNNVFRELPVRGGKVVLVNHPIRYDGEVPPLRHFGVEIGHHTREVLLEVGYRDDQVDAMLEQGCARTDSEQGRDAMAEYAEHSR